METNESILNSALLDADEGGDDTFLSNSVPVQSVHITDTEEVSDGKKHTVYSITAHSEGVVWSVRRRFKQFHELHTKLKASVSAEALPNLPSKKMFSRDDKTISKRRQELEMYLNELLTNTLTCSSPDVIAFLESSSAFASLRKQVNSLEQKIHRYESEKQDTLEFAKKVQAEAERAVAESLRYQESIAELQQQRSRQEEELCVLRPKFDEASQRLDQTYGKLLSLTKQSRTQESEHRQLSRKLDSAVKNESIMQAALSESKRQLDDCKEQTKHLHARVRDIEAQLGESERIVSEQRREIASNIETIQNLKSKVRQAELAGSGASYHATTVLNSGGAGQTAFSAARLASR